MRKQILTFIFILGLFSNNLFCQGEPINVRVQSIFDKVYINYDLIDTLYIDSNFKVKVFLKTQYNNDFSQEVFALSGDVGMNVAVGENHEIIWDVLADFPEGIEIVNMRIDLRVSRIVELPSIEMVEVKGGVFDFGCTIEQDSILPKRYGVFRRVEEFKTRVNDFEISKYETKVEDFIYFLNSISYNHEYSKRQMSQTFYDSDYPSNLIDFDNGFYHVKDNNDTYNTYPVENATWIGAYTFARWMGGRLPTEAEWEYAARGGRKSQGYFFSGSNEVDDVAWYKDNGYKGSKPSYKDLKNVGSKSPNELGLYDMSGSVQEWCLDATDFLDRAFGDEFKENQILINPVNRPEKKATLGRILKGGSLYNSARYVSPCTREGISYSGTGYIGLAGFRIVKSSIQFDE